MNILSCMLSSRFLIKSIITANSTRRLSSHVANPEMLVEIRQLANSFTKKFITPNAAYHDKTGEYPESILHEAWKAGLLNHHIPAAYGGSDLSVMEAVAISEEMAFGCTGIWTATEANNLAQAPLLVAGSEEQKKKYLGRMIEQPLICSYCVTEPGAGSDVAGIGTTARKSGSDWIINGTKMWITGGSKANWYFVLAKVKTEQQDKSEKPSFVAFIVERDAPGSSNGKLEIGPKEQMMGQRASDTRMISFNDVIVPDSQRLGNIGDGFKIAMKAFDHTRPIIGAGAVGLSRRALHEALNYSTQRKTMNKVIGDHQLIAGILADMATRIEASAGLVYKAATVADNGQRNSLEASMAKWFASKTATFCASSSVQILGGMGYSQASPTEKLYRDAKLFEIYEGTNEIQQLVISRLLLERQKQMQE